MTTREALTFLGTKSPQALINLRRDNKIVKAYQPGGNKWIYDENELRQIKEQIRKGNIVLRFR